MIKLSVVVPCYNEEEVLPETAKRLIALLTDMTERGRISEGSRVVFVDDGSRDRTWPIIESLAAESALVSGIKLSRNKGHQTALMGLYAVSSGN